MYFPEKFYRIPLHFDHQRLLAEISAVDESHWSPHPQKFKGNDALILLSSGGTINDLNYGPMEFTPCMEQLPYLKQVLESFNTIIGRTRLMRLAPGEKVNRHSDISLYWWHRFRIHVPIVTDPRVKFYCEDTHVHMQAGEAWTFDNWRYHEVHNDSDITRVHLVIDTVGSPALWNMLEQHSWNPQPGETLTPANFVSKKIAFDPDRTATFPIEKYNIVGLLSPAELDAIANFLLQDMDLESSSAENITRTKICLNYIKREWRALWSEHGNQESCYPLFSSLLQKTVAQINTFQPKPTLLSNGFLLANVLSTQVSLTMADVLRKLNEKNSASSLEFDIRALQDALSIQHKIKPLSPPPVQSVIPVNSANTTSSAPIFILAMPCSGGLIVENILAQSRALKSLEASQKQFLDEQFSAAKGQQVTDQLSSGQASRELQTALYQILKNSETQNPVIYFDLKNALRLDLLQACFPKARYVFVWRNPQHVLNQLLGDWLSGAYQTSLEYKGKSKKWSYPLPANWQKLFEGETDSPLAEKVHFQFQALSQALLQGHARIAPENRFNLFYEQLIAEPAISIQALCDFCTIPFGPKMRDQADKVPLLGYQIPEQQGDLLLQASAQCLLTTEATIARLKELY